MSLTFAVLKLLLATEFIFKCRNGNLQCVTSGQHLTLINGEALAADPSAKFLKNFGWLIKNSADIHISRIFTYVKKSGWQMRDSADIWI